MRRSLFLAAGVLLPFLLRAQGAEPDIRHYLALIDAGKTEQVRAEVPALLTRHPNNPGVLYLQGLTTSDGAEAVRIFQSIVDNFPRCEWADGALFRVYQFYYALGLYRTAEMKLTQLRNEYPNSPYLRQTGKTDVKALTEEPGPAASGQKAGSGSGLVYDSAATPPHPAAAGAASSAPAKQALMPEGTYALQVGAYSTQANADRQKSFFEGLGYTVDVISKVKDNRTLILVIVGSFPSYEAAKAEAADIKRQYNLDCIVITR